MSGWCCYWVYDSIGIEKERTTRNNPKDKGSKTNDEKRLVSTSKGSETKFIIEDISVIRNRQKIRKNCFIIETFPPVYPVCR